MPSIGAYLLVGAVAAIITFTVTPVVKRFAMRAGWVYEPNERTVHTTPLPDVGGIAMFLGFCAAFGLRA